MATDREQMHIYFGGFSAAKAVVEELTRRVHHIANEVPPELGARLRKYADSALADYQKMENDVLDFIL